MNSPARGIPRYREYGGPAVFRQGFRPFFLGAGVWAAAAVALWIPMVQGALSLPTAFDPMGWHVHEMLFGYVFATIAGFALTAIPNWTGRMPLQGPGLIALFALWLAGRIAVAFSAAIGPAAAAAVDLAFPVAFLGVAAREIVAGRNWRNMPVLAALCGLLAANALTHLEPVGLAATQALGQRLGIAVVVLLISLIGGRVVPSFTRNWLKKRGSTALPAPFDAVDRVSLAVLAVALALWVAAPETSYAGAALMAAGIALLLRFVRWRGDLTLAEPLVWSLHLGFAWLPAGLLLLGAAAFEPALVSTAGLHALGAGAMGGMTLAVMTRATRGHTGRALSAGASETAIYLSVALAAALRVTAALLPAQAMPLLWAAAAAWIAAFGLFAARYGPMVLSARGE